MKNFRYWRKMTWVILLGSALLLVWVVTSGFSLSVLGFALALIGVFGAVWFMTQPPWRQGRGIHLRRLQYVHVPFKVPRSTQDVG